MEYDDNGWIVYRYDDYAPQVAIGDRDASTCRDTSKAPCYLYSEDKSSLGQVILNDNTKWEHAKVCDKYCQLQYGVNKYTKNIGYCLKANGDDIVQTNFSEGNNSFLACSDLCDSKSECSGFEFKISASKTCNLILSGFDDPATQGNGNTDYECWVKQTTVKTI